jgi:transcriptional regulator with XRE-family HTH domain
MKAKKSRKAKPSPIPEGGKHTRTIFGANVKHYRKVRGLSQAELAEKMHVSVKHLSAVERGLTFVSSGFLDNLNKVLEISISYFFEEVPER